MSFVTVVWDMGCFLMKPHARYCAASTRGVGVSMHCAGCPPPPSVVQRTDSILNHRRVQPVRGDGSSLFLKAVSCLLLLPSVTTAGGWPAGWRPAGGRAGCPRGRRHDGGPAWHRQAARFVLGIRIGRVGPVSSAPRRPSRGKREGEGERRRMRAWQHGRSDALRARLQATPVGLAPLPRLGETVRLLGHVSRAMRELRYSGPFQLDTRDRRRC